MGEGREDGIFFTHELDSIPITPPLNCTTIGKLHLCVFMAYMKLEIKVRPPDLVSFSYLAHFPNVDHAQLDED